MKFVSFAASGPGCTKVYQEIPQQKVLNDPESETQKGHAT